MFRKIIFFLTCVLIIAVAALSLVGCGNGDTPQTQPAPAEEPAPQETVQQAAPPPAEPVEPAAPSVGSGSGDMFDPYIMEAGTLVSAYLADYYHSSFMIYMIFYAMEVEPGRTYTISLDTPVLNFDPELDEWTRRVLVDVTEDMGSAVEHSVRADEDGGGQLTITPAGNRLYLCVNSYHPDVTFNLLVE